MGELPSVPRNGSVSDIMSNLLEADRLTKVFSRGVFKKSHNVAVRDLSLAIGEEEPSITVIAGESGSGKTTLASMLLGFLKPSHGAIRFRGNDIYQLKGADWRDFRRNVQPVFQDPFEVFNPVYRVDRILTQPAKLYGLAGSDDEARELIEEALRQVGLRPAETLGRFPHQLSGGQRQRITVARAFLLKPRVLIADEPVSMIDASLRATVLESLRELKTELGVSIVYITHDLMTAFQIGDAIYVLYKGDVVEAGDAEKVIQHPAHPYTRLLMGSIPVPDPRVQWGEDLPVTTSSDDASLASHRGCVFAPRCPDVHELCRQESPPHFASESGRAVKCFLYDDKPEVDNSRLMEATAIAK